MQTEFTPAKQVALIAEVLTGLLVIWVACILPLFNNPVTFTTIVEAGLNPGIIGILLMAFMLLTIFAPFMVGILFLVDSCNIWFTGSIVMSLPAPDFDLENFFGSIVWLYVAFIALTGLFLLREKRS